MAIFERSTHLTVVSDTVVHSAVLPFWNDLAMDRRVDKRSLAALQLGSISGRFHR